MDMKPDRKEQVLKKQIINKEVFEEETSENITLRKCIAIFSISIFIHIDL